MHSTFITQGFINTMTSNTKFLKLESNLHEIQNLLKCSICSKTVQGPTKVLPCNHLACAKCQGQCCRKRIKGTQIQPRNDVQEFAQRFGDLLKAYKAEKEVLVDMRPLSTSEKKKKKNKGKTSGGPVNTTTMKPLSRRTKKEKKQKHVAEKPLQLVAVAEPLKEVHNEQIPIMQSEDSVEIPMDLSTPVRQQCTPAKMRTLASVSSSSWMPLDLSGKPAAAQQSCGGSGLQARVYARSFASTKVYSSDFSGFGLPQGRAVVSSPFIPQMDNPREENGVAKRKVVESFDSLGLEQQERKKTKLQSNAHEGSLQNLEREINSKIVENKVEKTEDVAEPPRQQQVLEPSNEHVESITGKNGTVVRTDDDWDNDEEISLLSPAKLQATATPRPVQETANTASSDPFEDDFCFQTPEPMGSKDDTVIKAEKTPQQVKQALNGKSTPNRASASNKSLETVRTRLPLDGSSPSEFKEKKQFNEVAIVCDEDLAEFFSCSSDLQPQRSKKSANEEANRSHETGATPGKGNQVQVNPKSNVSTPASASKTKTPAKKTLASPRLTTANQAQRKSLVLCPTRLNRYQSAMLENFASTFGAKVTRNYTDDVTHVVFTLEKGAVPQTMKYLMAIAGKKWVLECGWIEECLKEKRIVREELYEATSEGDPGAKLSRLSKLPLFPGLRFYVHGNFTYSGASAKEWTTLIRTLGGQIQEDVHSLSPDVLVIGDSNDDITVYDDLYENYQAVTLAWEWVLACTIKYNLEPVTPNYCISPKTDSAEELATLIPAFLMEFEGENTA